MLNKKLKAYDVGIVCVRDKAAFIFLLDVVGKGYVLRKIVLVEGDNLLVGMPVFQRC